MNVLHIYKTTVYAATGRRVIVAVESDDVSHRSDLYTAVQTLLGGRVGEYRLHETTRTVRSKLTGFEPVQKCTTNNEPWAWVKYPKGK